MSPNNESTKPNALAELSAQLSEAVERVAASVVAIHARRRIPSTGIVWRDGVIVSASHTVRRDGDVPVALPNGETSSATIVGRDGASDLVALRMKDAILPPAAKADASALRVGSLVLALGRPGRNVSASFGIVSAVGEGWRTAQGSRLERVLRLDLAIYDGFSGGPLVAAAGGVLGIDTSALARGAPTALPASVVDRVLDQLLERGHVRRPFVGVAVHPVELSPGIVQHLGIARTGGLVVLSVADGGPAGNAGILVGDVLLDADDHPLSRPVDLLDAIGTVKDGAALELTVARGGALVKVRVTPIDRGAREVDE